MESFIFGLFAVIILASLFLLMQLLMQGNLKKGNEKWLKRDYKGAMQCFNRAIEKKPASWLAYLTRGDFKANALQDFKGGEEDLNKAINLNPKNPASYLSRGELKIMIKDYEGAIEDLTKAINLGLINSYSSYTEEDFNYWGARAYAYRADAKANLKDFEGAKDDYSKAIDLNPEFSDANQKLNEIKNGTWTFGLRDDLSYDSDGNIK